MLLLGLLMNKVIVFHSQDNKVNSNKENRAVTTLSNGSLMNKDAQFHNQANNFHSQVNKEA